MPTTVASPTNVEVDSKPDHPESQPPERRFLWWARFVASLLLLFLFLMKGVLGMLPILALFFLAVVGPKGSFRQLWRIVSWACVAGAAIHFLLVLLNLPLYVRGNALDWLAAGLVMWLIPKILGWKAGGEVNKVGYALAWMFGTIAGSVLLTIIGVIEFENWRSGKSDIELGMLSEATTPSVESLIIRFVVFCCAAFIAYRFDWLRKRGSQVLFGYLGRKIKEQD